MTIYRSLQLRSLPSAADLSIEDVGRHKRLYSFWNTIHARLFKGLALYNVVGNV